MLIHVADCFLLHESRRYLLTVVQERTLYDLGTGHFQIFIHLFIEHFQ
jgi:hypothetical protein